MKTLIKIYNWISAFSDWYWGIPALGILVVGGVALTFAIRGIQFTRFGFIAKNTLGVMFSKKEMEERKKGITSAQTVFAALGMTVGTGNIVGVASAIYMGGPGALFWMWVCGFVAMAIKYGEVLMSIYYREKRTDADGYLAGPFMYIRKILNTPLAMVFGLALIGSGFMSGAVHSRTITAMVQKINIAPFAVCFFLIIFMGIQIMGGWRRSVKISDVVVPFMAVAYTILALIIIFMNIENVGIAISMIFKGAFTGTAAIGGFSGATVMMAIRQGLARGVFSSDAGCGSQSVLHSQAENIEHPAQQGIWAIFETFVDTILVCSMTGLMILFTGVWDTGLNRDALVLEAVSSEFGSIAMYLVAAAIFFFACTSIMGIGNSIKFQALTYFRNNEMVAKICQVIFIAMIGAGCLLPTIENAFVLADFVNCFALTINMVALLIAGKKIRSMTDEYFFQKIKK